MMNKNNVRFFAKVNRIDSKIEVDAGYLNVLFCSGSCKSLKGKRCNYVLTITQKSFIIKEFCN